MLAHLMSPDDFAKLIAAPASDEVFEQVLALLQSTFDVPYYKSRGDVVRGSVAFATTPERRSRLIRVLSDGLQVALWRQPVQQVGPRPGLEANSVAVCDGSGLGPARRAQ